MPDGPLLRVRAACKSFPGVRALDGVDFEVGHGEVHGLIGENGAGKSTLLKILSGAHRPDAGTIEFLGQEIELATPHEAQLRGIVTIYQEFNLIPTLSVAENVLIGREPMRGLRIDWPKLRRRAREAIDRLGLRLPVSREVRDLSVAEQQMVEIARALSMQSRLIIMDEPTSALSDTEVGRLFEIVGQLRREGISIIFVTHRLDEALRLCDRITVLRDGRLVAAANIAEVGIGDLIRMMVGRDVSAASGPAGAPGEVALSVEGLGQQTHAFDPHTTVLKDISFNVRRGEILGLAGLVGAGRTELARAIFGADPFDRGRIFVAGREVRINSPLDAIRHSIGLVPEDRKQQALFLDLAIRENIAIAALDRISNSLGFVRRPAEADLVAEYRAALNIRLADPNQPVSNLSGGNQQKVVLARWLALNPDVLIVDEPTRGIDVAAKAEVHQLLRRLARSGIAVIAISSELPEILAVSDRILALREGRISGEISRAEATEERLMEMMALGRAA